MNFYWVVVAWYADGSGVPRVIHVSESEERARRVYQKVMDAEPAMRVEVMEPAGQVSL